MEEVEQPTLLSPLPTTPVSLGSHLELLESDTDSDLENAPSQEAVLSLLKDARMSLS